MTSQENINLFLDADSKIKLSKWLQGIDSIPGCNRGRLIFLQMAGSDYISMAELSAISDYMWPQALCDVIVPAEIRVTAVDRVNAAIKEMDAA